MKYEIQRTIQNINKKINKKSKIYISFGCRYNYKYLS